MASGVLARGAGPGMGGRSCSTLWLRDLPAKGRAAWPSTETSFFSPRPEAKPARLLLLLFRSDRAVVGRPGPAWSPCDCLGCKGACEAGGAPGLCGAWRR